MIAKGAGKPGSCGVCGSRLKRNGTTSAGRTRWRCTGCGSSSTRQRVDVSRRRELETFLKWLLGPSRQFDHGASARTFRRHHAWCWNIDPVIKPTGEIYDHVQLDGTYLTGGWCLLTATNPAGEVIAKQWCDTEKTAAWVALLEQIPPPVVAVVDGGQGLATALGKVWPDTLIQRCLVHVQRNVRRYVTINPRTEAGRGLRKLSLTLTRIKTTDEATAWLAALNDWHQRFGDYINERTHMRERGAVRPAWAKPTATSWWTHDRARKAYQLLARLAKHGHLFTYLDPELAGLEMASTTNRIEGGVNAQIKLLLRVHRGMSDTHRRRAIDWWCYLHSPQPAPTGDAHPARELRGRSSSKTRCRARGNPRRLRHRTYRRRRTLAPQRLGRTLKLTPTRPDTDTLFVR